MSARYSSKCGDSFNPHINCSCPMNSAGLNCVGPLAFRWFSVVTTMVLHGLWLAESTDAGY